MKSKSALPVFFASLFTMTASSLHGAIIADWNFNSGANSTELRTASSVPSGITVSTLNFNATFTDVGNHAVPPGPGDGFGFGGNSGDSVIFLRRSDLQSDSSWGGGTASTTGSGLVLGDAPIAFTVTADAITTITLDSLTVDWTGGANIIFQFQEAGASPGAGVTVAGAQDGRFNIPLAASVTVLPGQTKTFTININSGNYGSSHIIDGIALNGTAVPEPSTTALAGLMLAAGLLRRRRH